jgi:RNA recognition motif-containing protein
MKEKDEREGEGSRREGPRAPISNRKASGYIHRVDQSSISFYVTNFLEDCTTEDLWKVFSPFGRVGDVYIPNKVDKWGKRFAFVKFREMEVVELSQRLDDVWLGTFKLRINKSRFDRRESANKKVEVACPKVTGFGGGGFDSGQSFKNALMHSTRQGGEVSGGVDTTEESLEVEVDRHVLKELERSFVGRLAINIEVCRIWTTLYMEVLAHVSITEMGRNMVLIYSPRVREIEALCRAKAEWITYYFREVTP